MLNLPRPLCLLLYARRALLKADQPHPQSPTTTCGCRGAPPLCARARPFLPRSPAEVSPGAGPALAHAPRPRSAPGPPGARPGDCGIHPCVQVSSGQVNPRLPHLTRVGSPTRPTCSDEALRDGLRHAAGAHEAHAPRVRPRRRRHRAAARPRPRPRGPPMGCAAQAPPPRCRAARPAPSGSGQVLRGSQLPGPGHRKGRGRGAPGRRPRRAEGLGRGGLGRRVCRSGSDSPEGR